MTATTTDRESINDIANSLGLEPVTQIYAYRPCRCRMRYA
jgi:hypothetical protein